MKSVFENTWDAVKRVFKSAARAIAPTAATAAICAAAMVPAHCEAQTGTFVNTRPYDIWSGQLSTNTTSVTVFWTNFLNYSGFHRPGFWLSEMNTDAAGIYGSVSVQVNPIPYTSAQGFTNSVFGSNVSQYSSNGMIFPTNGPTIFGPLSCATGTTNLLNTNLDWPWADSVQVFQVKITYNGTNNPNGGYQVPFELDGNIAP
ncbi:MAG TPA: hypothetical protein VGY56_10685 [Verrucomicrobiae bacterium]|nr:hypothetical protein [Verrucomicrobiae bacterium]